MKHIRSLLATAAVLLLGAALLSSCDKNNPLAPNKSNPTEYSLPGHDFTVMVEDYEHGFSKDSNYVFEGVFKDGEFRFGLDKLDPMTLNILPDNQNQLILKVSSETEGFQGVNASSSARCINIVPDGKDHTVYHLEWVAEGESTITLWCGEDATRKEISFKATSKKEIQLTGIKMRIDGKEVIMKQMTAFDEEYNPVPGTYNWSGDAYFGQSAYTNNLKFSGKISTWLHKNPLDPSVHHTIEIIGPEPLNATTPKLHIFFDGFGIQDPWKQTSYMGENGEDFYHYTDETIWPRKKRFNLYDKNLEYNPQFRWFKPITMPEYKDEFNETRGNLPLSTTVIQRMPILYMENPDYTLRPSDLRERFTWIFDATGDYRGTFIPLVFATDWKDYGADDIRWNGFFHAFFFRDSRYSIQTKEKMLY